MYYNATVKTRKARTMTVRLEPDLAERMEEVRERWGTPFSVQIRRALDSWLDAQGFARNEAGRKRADTRKRP